MSGGLIGTLIGLVAVLHYGNSDSFGPGIATAMITILYAALLSYAVCLPIQYRLEGQLSSGSMNT
jgi:flagellar motor component MotA